MPDTSYNGIQVPDATDPYGFEQILGALADSARVIVPAANATAMAQVATAATTAGFGATASAPLYVHRTDQDAVYVNKGGGWLRLTGKADSTPFAVAAGSVVYDLAGTSGQTYPVTFPSGRFSSAPIIVTGGGPHSALQFTVASNSATGFTMGVYTSDGSTSTLAGSARWMAIQMTPTSGPG